MLQKHEQENGKTLRKYSKDEKHAIYETPLEEQFKTVYNGGENGMVQRHVLKDTNAMDYERVLSAGALYAKKEEVLLMPEIHSSERNIRELLGLPEKSNPDLKVGGRWIDVKSPFSTSTIIANANHAAKQGAIACITDDHCVIELSKINGMERKYWMTPITILMKFILLWMVNSIKLQQPMNNHRLRFATSRQLTVVQSPRCKYTK